MCQFHTEIREEQVAQKTRNNAAESILCLGWRSCGRDNEGVHITSSSAPKLVKPGQEYKDVTVAASNILPLASRHHLTRVVMKHEQASP